MMNLFSMLLAAVNLMAKPGSGAVTPTNYEYVHGSSVRQTGSK
jgi:hypothetical protein